MPSPLTLAGGFALGLASTLHCIGMCGGIAAMTMVPTERTTSLPRALATIHAGRLCGYMLLGAACGGLGATVLGGLEPGLGNRLLRWAAAVSLGYIGLSTAGLMPAPVALARFAPSCRISGLTGGGSRFLAGLAWGLMPCAMVYGALLYAMFTASFLSGALVMAGFGIGTLPGVLGASACFKALRAIRGRPFTKLFVGASISLFGIASLVDPGPAFLAMCQSIRL